MKFPREAWIAAGINPASLPDDTDVPDRVPGLFTTQIPGNVNVFDTIALSAEGTELDLRLIVVGTFEQAPNLLYVLDPYTGQVLQFDPSSVQVRGVNSTYRWFIEFLKRVSHAMASAGTEDPGTVLTTGLKFTLRAVDDTAFEAGAWWPMVFKQLARS
ncbi:SUKH-4 family immunity protein [Glycomyces luteolus]|uniref:SUKH-4 family immunity protein n=1 Tax=Glycomyces luteolus TaxID=2670330 RepID=A0A9X3PD05_9ACTN|nr:SUKH-4 family immunity protein [Glycomyces luteolus]MDA1363111.1 SUKH-4 family immunity protein [Glycomyces luteolus]